MLLQKQRDNVESRSINANNVVQGLHTKPSMLDDFKKRKSNAISHQDDQVIYETKEKRSKVHAKTLCGEDSTVGACKQYHELKCPECIQLKRQNNK